MQTNACGISAMAVRPASKVLTQALICNSRSEVVTLAMERGALEFIMSQGVLPNGAQDSPDSDVTVRQGPATTRSSVRRAISA